MKKFLTSIAFVARIFLVMISSAAAQDVYIESDSGRDIYIVTESIDTNGNDYVNVTLKYIKNGRSVYTEHRIYGKASDGMWWLTSEEAKRDNLRATRVWEPAKDKILQYCLSHR